MRFAYADPPYLGQCAKYDHYHPDGLCWNDTNTHWLLIERLQREFPDGWALSSSSVSLRDLLPECPTGARVAAWVKPFCAFKRGVRPAYAWEPVIFYGGRNPSNGYIHPPPVKGGQQTTPKDFIAESITLQRGLTGAKPERFCRWILDLLNAQPSDELVDLFPGTGVMGHVVNYVKKENQMSYRDALKIFNLERQLNNDQKAFLNTLRSMTDSERELLAESLGPPVKTKGSGKSSPTPTRTFEKCEVCNWTRRAGCHRDTDFPDYHEFVSSKPKSKRASSIASAISGTSGRSATSLPDGAGDGLRALCTFEIGGKVCHGLENDGIHDATMGYSGYHEFQPPLASAAGGD